MITLRHYYRVDRRKISLLRFTFEAYEGVAVVTTLDARAGLIVLAVAPCCEALVDEIMADLGLRFMIEACEAPAPRDSDPGGGIYKVRTDSEI